MDNLTPGVHTVDARPRVWTATARMAHVMTQWWQNVTMPKIIGGSLAEHREQTRNKLFTALATLMDDRGFDSITLAQIAQAAKIGRTAVYNHFPDKESLLVGFINHETEQYVASLERELENVDDPVDQLRTYVRAQMRLKRVFHLAPGPDLRTVVSRGTQHQLREHADMVEGILKRIIGTGIERRAFPPQDLSVTVALVNACLSGRTLGHDDASRAVATRATEEFVLRAIGVPPASASSGVAVDDEPALSGATTRPAPTGPAGCPFHH